MLEKIRKSTFLKPVLLIAMQIIALFVVFDILSADRDLAQPFEWQLTVAVGIIFVGGLLTFKALRELKKEEMAHIIS